MNTKRASAVRVTVDLRALKRWRPKSIDLPRCARVAFATLAGLISPLAFAGVTFSGAVNPNPPVSPVDILDVGSGSVGTFAVDGGSTFTANALTVGNGGTGNGTVTITGTTSGGQTMLNLLGNTNSNPFVVGAWGIGAMTVSQGAKINGLTDANCGTNLCNSLVANTAGSSGTLTLTGAGTTASLGGFFTVGLGVAFTSAAGDGFNFGTPGGTSTGVINVQNGAALNTYSTSLAAIGTSHANLGTEQAVAHVTVDGTGSIWTVSQNPVTGANAGAGMASGQNSTATLAVTNAGQVVIAGANSFLNVGGGGSATVTIGSGGSLSVANVGIGNATTGSGLVTVGDGTGQSILTVTNSIGVGNQSTANSQLTVNVGGTVNVTGPNGLGIAGSAGSHGTVLVDGGTLNVSGTNAFVGVGNGGTGVMTVQNAGVVSVSGANGGMGIGGQTGSNGSLTVSSGAAVTVSGSGGIGVANSSGSTGSVLVDGGTLTVNGSNAFFGLANAGSGTLTVQNGGVVNLTGTNGMGIAGSVGSNGSVLIDGGQLNVSGTNSGIGVGNNGTGSLTVQNGGVLVMSGQNHGIGVGGSGSGTMSVTTGSSVTAEQLNIGGSAGSTGIVSIVGTPSGAQTRVTLNGPGSAGDSASALNLGAAGNGTMTVSGGAIVNVAIGNANCGIPGTFCNNFIGNGAGSTGSLTLTDHGTTMNLAGGLTVGGGAVFTSPPSQFAFGTPGGTTTATVTVQNGATLNTYGNVTLSTGPGGANPTGNEHTNAHVIVDGAGSSWNLASDPITGATAGINMATGPNATATLDVTNGAHLTMAGQNFGVTVGSQGSGTLSVNTGGSLTTESLTVAGGQGSTGVVNIVGTASAPQTMVTLNGAGAAGNGTSPLSVGNWGNGTMTVSGGAIVNGAIGNANCGAPNTGCANFVGNGAGSTGSLTLTGAGTTMNLAGGLTVGGGAVFTNPPNNFAFGTPGGTTNATVTVQNGATLNTYGNVTLSQGPAGSNPTGTEQTNAHVTIDGAGSSWNLASDPVTGVTAGLNMANAANAIATLDVTNGGHITMAGQNLGITVGGNGAGAASRTGTINVNTGGSVTTESLTIAVGPTSTGVVNIVGTTSGPQTIVTLNGPASASNPTNLLQVGAWGNGMMTVSGGATVNAAVGNVNCGLAFCQSSVGTVAGSTGSLTLTDPGTTMTLAGGFTVGSASVTTNPPNAFNFGTPGGTTNATLNVLNGATLNTYAATVSTGPTGPNPTGDEQTNAHIIIDGAGSSWNVTSDPINPNNAQAFIGVSPRANATAVIDITNGGKLTVTGSGSNPQPQMNLTGGGQAGGSSTVNVTGAGSAIVFNGDTGLIQLGRNGGTAEMNITGGGKVYGTGTNGLTGMNIGRMGSNATLNIDGSGSSLTLSGVNSNVNGNTQGTGAGMVVGRDAGGVGAVNVTSGGSILFTDAGQNANASGVGILFGRDAGTSGSLTVSGANSTVTIEQTGLHSTGSPGFTAGVSGDGHVSVLNGGAILIHNEGLDPTGSAGGITIARNAGSTGSLTVSGPGSNLTIELVNATGASYPGIVIGRAGNGQMTITNGATVVVNGPTERDVVVGTAAGGTGTLTVSNGAQLTASWFTVGNTGGTGTATIDNATVLLNGVAANPDLSLFGASVRVGRVTGSTGTLDLVHGAQITIDTATAGASVNLGGTGAGLGGNGTLNMSGGSSISFIGTGATPSVNIGHSGIGLFTMTGGSTLSMPDDGSIVLGNRSSGSGTLQLGGGSTIDTGFVIVGNSGQGAVTMTSGTLNLHNIDGDVAGLVVGFNNGSVGTFAQSGGTVNASRGLVIASQVGSSGSYTLTGGTLNTGGGGVTAVGDRGTGVFTNNATAAPTNHNVTGLLTLGGDPLVNGSYTITGNDAHTNVSFVPGGIGPTNPPGLNGSEGGVARPAPNGALGVGIGGIGTFTQGAANQSDPGNSVTVAGDVVVGVFAGSTGTYTLNTGSLTVGGKLVVGAVSQGANVFTQNGGSVTITGAASANPDYIGLGGNNLYGTLVVGGGINDLGGGKGTYVMSGGNLTASGAAIGNNGGNGTFTQSGGSANFGSLSVGTSSNGPASIGAYTMSGAGATLAVSGDLIIGDAGIGAFTQNGSTNTIGGQLILGNQTTGNGTYIAQNGATATLTGTTATARVLVGNQGTGALTVEGGSTVSLPGDGSVIVGATASGVGTVFVTGGSSINAGSFFGIGSDASGSTGGRATVIVDDPASSIAATTVAIGAGGCLAGNGVIHGNVVMNGPTANVGACPPAPNTLITALGSGPGITPFGIINAGRSPGRLVIDGGFQFISGTIVLEVESDGQGGFLVDQLVFTGVAPINLALSSIEFSFLGNTDPNAFEASGNWDLNTFFKINTGTGPDQPISIGLDKTLEAIFAQSTFAASADAYTIENFTFTPEGGVESITAVPIASVPEPAPWMLMLGALLLLYLARVRQLRAIARRG